MAIVFHSILRITCDEESSPICWNSDPDTTSIFLEDNETKDDGIATLIRMGWEFLEEGKHICPGCGAKKLSRDDYSKDHRSNPIEVKEW